MVFLALSPRGVESYEALGSDVGPIWLSAGVLTEGELLALRSRHRSVTDFGYSMSADESAVIAEAVETIKEHHPGQAVWVES